MRHEVYAEIKRTVEAAGFYTSAMPMDSGGDRLVCVGLKGRRLGGNSFWVAERRGVWLLGTWAGFLYRVADAPDVPDLCVALLRNDPREIVCRPPAAIAEGFGLREASDGEFAG